MADIISAALAAKDAARYLSVSTSKLYDLVNGGDLNIVKLGHRTLFRRADLDALLERGSPVQRHGRKAVRPTSIFE